MIIKDLTSKAGCAKLCEALPGFYALTGCNYILSFYKKEKTRQFDKFEKSEDYPNVVTIFATCTVSTKKEKKKT